jgi:hypothetical protein
MAQFHMPDETEVAKYFGNDYGDVTDFVGSLYMEIGMTPLAYAIWSHIHGDNDLAGRFMDIQHETLLGRFTEEQEKEAIDRLWPEFVRLQKGFPGSRDWLPRKRV